MSKIFFEELKLPEPDYNLGVSSGLVGNQTGEIITKVEEILIKEKPDITLVYGDVTSSVAAGLASVKLKIPVVHIEGGIRTNSKWNPEDINRKLCDHLSDIVFTPTDLSLNNLRKENFPEDKIFNLGDTTKDILLKTVKEYGIKKSEGDYILLTMHRAENTDNIERFKNIISALSSTEEKIIFPIHPRTKKRLKEFGLSKIFGENIQLIEPQSYVNFIKYIANAKKVVTDSGTVRREAYILGKPVITLIDIIWWPEIVECGWNKIVSDNKDKIIDAIKNFIPPENHPNIFGDGNAEKKILTKILDIYG
jgi:UDP-N-acetylglucosamine 2-epimerase